jgi:LacI family transcriptional regulator
MIAIVTNMGIIFGRGVHDGVIQFAEEHRRKGWRDVVNVPFRCAMLGQVNWKQFRGIVAQVWDREADATFASCGVPVVNVSARVPDSALPSVLPDDFAAGVLVGNYFLKRGYRDFAYYAAPFPFGTSDRRGAGFVSAIRVAGHEVLWLGEYPASLPAGARRVRSEPTSFLRSLPKPAAILASNDYLAAELYNTAAAANVAVPEQVSLVGVDNDPFTHYAMLGISSVELPARRIGYEAAALLHRLMRGEESEKSVTLIPVDDVITRSSSDSMATEDQDVLDAMRYIRNHAGDGIEVSDVVRAVALGRRTLERRFRAAFGISPKDEINRARIEIAKRLLTRTRMSIPEVAQAAGYCDRSRLSTAFKLATGVSPRRYRDTNTRLPSHVTASYSPRSH